MSSQRENLGLSTTILINGSCGVFLNGGNAIVLPGNTVCSQDKIILRTSYGTRMDVSIDKSMIFIDKLRNLIAFFCNPRVQNIPYLIPEKSGYIHIKSECIFLCTR